MEQEQQQSEVQEGKERQTVKMEDDYPEVITPWYLLGLLKPIIREEFIALCRYDRSGVRMKFCNGQKFRLTITEIT
ncbi:MAG: hypothetical protein K2J54_01120 [Clostridia bacterium]|nr:hypothetical protein [Clostridia bacterium]